LREESVVGDEVEGLVGTRELPTFVLVLREDPPIGVLELLGGVDVVGGLTGSELYLPESARIIGSTGWEEGLRVDDLVSE
jgi:hypothetical protein